jgi:endo-1,4-beta-xylanase
MNFVKSQYNSITLENEMKPDGILGWAANTQNNLPSGYINNKMYPYQGQYIILNFDTVDEAIELAYEAGLKMRFHVLLWHAQTPTWFFKDNFKNDGNYVDEDTMNGRMEYYIRNVMHHVYNTPHGKDVMYAWDVVNEYTHSYNGEKKSDWDEVYYPEDVYVKEERKDYSGRNNPCYVLDAFKIADDQLADLEKQGKIPSADAIELFYNDFNEYMDDTTTAIIALIDNINKNGKLCDGVGMQMHLGINFPNADMIGTALDRFHAKGYAIQMTEIDVTSYPDDNRTEEEHTQYWSDLFEMIVAKKSSGININCITFWGLADNASWRSAGTPLLFSDINRPKESFYAVLEAAKGYTKSTA